ncbi:MAG: hypothetical protein LH479_10470 [Polaromonas sp.]|nr:hypothetical protein [Polaromonas sp.]
MAIRFISSVTPGVGDAFHMLGGALLGNQASAGLPGGALQHVCAPLLGVVQDALSEAWVTDSMPQAGHADGVNWRRSGDVLYGVIELDERGTTAEPSLPTLQALSEQAYASVFRLLDAQGLPHLWRVWNYMADIHGQAGGLERYRQFNLGRGDAFLKNARAVVGRVPAACAIGVGSGPLSIAFLAGATPALSIENPRQVSAYDYPVEYGPRSPTFSRAALVYPPGQEFLFISGTASIVGHRSMHGGDVAAQCRETMDNIAAVVTEANRRGRNGPFALGDLSYRVYVRHAADHPLVQDSLAARVGAVPVVYVQADICRGELLVEVEAMGLRRI